MTCRVIKPFEALAPMEFNRPRLFQPGDILENVDYASGELALFQISGHGDSTVYQLPIEEFKQYITIVSF
jgi:hypothetical protein